jgi:hypothetical protein
VLAVGLIVIVAVILGFVLGLIFRDRDGEAGQGSPSASASTSVPASVAPASLAPSAVPSASAPVSPDASAPPPVVAAPDGLIPPGSAVRVLIDGLRMRESPSTTATLVENLPLGRLLAVGHSRNRGDFGPIEADGFAWYPVIVIPDATELPPLSAGPILLEAVGYGWVAAGDGTEPYIQLLDPRCPVRPVTLPVVEAMLPWEQLACFGAEPMTLEGTFGCGVCSGIFPGTFEPAWLAFPFSGAFLSGDPNARVGPFAMRFAPGGPAQPAHGRILRVVGHFDDPSAIGCTVAPGEPPVPLDPTAAELYCREQFVVESIEETGTDPDFP